MELLNFKDLLLGQFQKWTPKGTYFLVVSGCTQISSLALLSQNTLYIIQMEEHSIMAGYTDGGAFSPNFPSFCWMVAWGWVHIIRLSLSGSLRRLVCPHSCQQVAHYRLSRRTSADPRIGEWRTVIFIWHRYAWKGRPSVITFSIIYNKQTDSLTRSTSQWERFAKS